MHNFWRLEASTLQFRKVNLSMNVCCSEFETSKDMSTVENATLRHQVYSTDLWCTDPKALWFIVGKRPFNPATGPGRWNPRSAGRDSLKTKEGAPSQLCCLGQGSKPSHCKVSQPTHSMSSLVKVKDSQAPWAAFEKIRAFPKQSLGFFHPVFGNKNQVFNGFHQIFQKDFGQPPAGGRASDSWAPWKEALREVPVSWSWFSVFWCFGDGFCLGVLGLLSVGFLAVTRFGSMSLSLWENTEADQPAENPIGLVSEFSFWKNMFFCFLWILSFFLFLFLSFPFLFFPFFSLNFLPCLCFWQFVGWFAL